MGFGDSWNGLEGLLGRKREPSSPLRLPGDVSMIEVASIPSTRMMFCSTARPENRMSPKVPEPELVAPGTRR